MDQTDGTRGGAAHPGDGGEQLLARARVVAAGLADLGVGPGSGVMLVLGDVPERAEAVLALSLLDAVLVPESPELIALVASGHVTHVIVAEDATWELDGVAGNVTRIAVGAKQVGWARYPG